MVCPKCGTPIKRFDLSPNCKRCGVHIMYYTQEADLARDAKKTELEFAKARAFTSRLKAAFIADKYAITRMVFVILTIASLCIPFSSVTLTLPYRTANISVGAIGAYSLYSDGLFTHLFDFLSAGIAHDVAVTTLANLICFVALVLFVLLIFLAWLLSFINMHKAAKVLCIFSGLAALSDIACVICAALLLSQSKAYSYISASLGAGAFAVLAVLSVVFILNYIIYKANKPLNIKEVDLQRIEIAKKVKAGEVKLDNLPLPIYETEEERLKREQAFSDTSKKKKRTDKKKDGVGE